MPFQWIPAPVAFVHNGVRIYQIFKDDDVDNGYVREYWFGTTVACNDCGEDAMDVRTMPNPLHHDLLTPAGRRAVICDAIDAGHITNE